MSEVIPKPGEARKSDQDCLWDMQIKLRQIYDGPEDALVDEVRAFVKAKKEEKRTHPAIVGIVEHLEKELEYLRTHPNDSVKLAALRELLRIKAEGIDDVLRDEP